MKTLLLTAAALIAMTTLAAAADLPNRAVVEPPVSAPGFSWSGFYAGVHGAWFRDEGEALRTGLSGASPEALPTRAGLSDSGMGGGGQIGYLIQFGNIVAGLEADLTALDLERTRRFEAADGAFNLQTDLTSRISLFGTVKGRVGVAMPSLLPVFEQSFYYVTGGLAYAQVEHRGQTTVTPPGLGPLTENDDVKIGFVVGGGTEHAITQNISIKSETVYYDLEDDNLVLARADDQATYRFRSNGWISRVGLNVRF